VHASGCVACTVSRTHVGSQTCAHKHIFADSQISANTPKMKLCKRSHDRTQTPAHMCTHTHTCRKKHVRTCMRCLMYRRTRTHTCHEDEDVTRGVPEVNCKSLLHSSLHIVFLRGAAPQHIYRERPATHGSMCTYEISATGCYTAASTYSS